MKLIETHRQGGLKGSLYLEKLGYTYKIKAKVQGRTQVVARSYVYLLHKEQARQKMLDDMQALSGQPSLFDILNTKGNDNVRH